MIVTRHAATALTAGIASFRNKPFTSATERARTRAAALSKLIGADMVQKVADTTLQIFGGAGYSKEEPIERIWRETRVVRILDGTSEMMRRIVARDLYRAADRRNAQP